MLISFTSPQDGISSSRLGECQPRLTYILREKPSLVHTQSTFYPSIYFHFFSVRPLDTPQDCPYILDNETQTNGVTQCKTRFHFITRSPESRSHMPHTLHTLHGRVNGISRYGESFLIPHCGQYRPINQMESIMTNTVSINLPADVIIAKRNGASVTLSTGKLSAEMIAQLCLHGMGQKVRDSASGEPTIEGSIVAMEATVETLYADEWIMRGESGEVDPLQAYRLQIVRKSLGRADNADKKAIYDAIDSKDQAGRREYLVSLLEAVPAKTRKAIDDAAEKAKELDDNKKLAQSVTINF